MNQEFEKSPKLQKWLHWMETIRNEISGLLRDEACFGKSRTLSVRIHGCANLMFSMAIFEGHTFLMH